MWGENFPLPQSDAKYKVFMGEYTPHCQTWRVNSMHRANFKGVNLHLYASKKHKLCVIRSPHYINSHFSWESKTTYLPYILALLLLFLLFVCCCCCCFGGLLTYNQKKKSFFLAYCLLWNPYCKTTPKSRTSSLWSWVHLHK